MKKKQGARLDFIAADDDRQGEVARASGRSRWVRRGRWLLPLIVVGVAVGLFVWPMLTMEHIRTAAIKSVPNLVLENVHFRGLDNRNNPYEVRAERAIRPSNDAHIVVLEKPEGKLSLSETGAAVMHGASQIGRYDEQAKRLWLGGFVDLSDDRGMRMRSEEALVDMPKNMAWGSKPVFIEGDFGVIEGEGFELFGDEAIIVVRGPAKATLNLHPAQGSGRSE